MFLYLTNICTQHPCLQPMLARILIIVASSPNKSSVGLATRITEFFIYTHGWNYGQIMHKLSLTESA